MKIVGNLRNISDPARELSLHDRTIALMVASMQRWQDEKWSREVM